MGKLILGGIGIAIIFFLFGRLTAISREIEERDRGESYRIKNESILGGVRDIQKHLLSDEVVDLWAINKDINAMLELK